jgi:hypothetical protein
MFLSADATDKRFYIDNTINTCVDVAMDRSGKASGTVVGDLKTPCIILTDS